MARQRRELEEASAKVQARSVGRREGGRPTVGGAANVGAQLITPDTSSRHETPQERQAALDRARNEGRRHGAVIGRQQAKGIGKGKGCHG